MHTVHNNMIYYVYNTGYRALIPGYRIIIGISYPELPGSLRIWFTHTNNYK